MRLNLNIRKGLYQYHTQKHVLYLKTSLLNHLTVIQFSLTFISKVPYVKE